MATNSLGNVDVKGAVSKADSCCIERERSSAFFGYKALIINIVRNWHAFDFTRVSPENSYGFSF